MKRLILFLIIIVTNLDVAHGSFPINTKCVSDKILRGEIKYHHYNSQKMVFDLNFCNCISCTNDIETTVINPDLLPIIVEEVIQKEKRIPSGANYVFFSLLSALASLIFGLLSMGNGLSHTGSNAAVLPLFLLSTISIIGSVILALKAKKHEVKLSVVILALALALLVGLFLFPLFFV